MYFYLSFIFPFLSSSALTQSHTPFFFFLICCLKQLNTLNFRNQKKFIYSFLGLKFYQSQNWVQGASGGFIVVVPGACKDGGMSLQEPSAI